MQAVRNASILLLVVCHMQAIVPAAAPASLALFAVCHLAQFRLYRTLPAAIAYAGIFLLYCLFLLVIHGILRDYSVIDVIRTSGRLLYMMGVLLVVAHLRPSTTFEKPLLLSVLGTTTAISLAAIFSRYVSPLAIGDMPLNSERALTGFFENHNTMAGAVGVALLMSLLAWLHAKQGRLPRLYSPPIGAVGAFLGVAFALCLSRAYCIGMVAACSGIAWAIPQRKLRQLAYFVGAGAAGVMILFVLLKRSDEIDVRNVHDRTYLYRRAVSEVVKSPLLGIGPSAFQELHGVQRTIVPGLLVVRQSGVIAADDQKSTHDIHGAGGAHVHNTYLQLLCDYGLIGAALLGLVLLAFWRGYREVRAELRANDDPPLLVDYADWNAKVFLASFAFLAVSGLFVNWCFSSPPYTLCGFAALGRFTAFHNDWKTS